MVARADFRQPGCVCMQDRREMKVNGVRFLGVLEREKVCRGESLWQEMGKISLVEARHLLKAGAVVLHLAAICAFLSTSKVGS